MVSDNPAAEIEDGLRKLGDNFRQSFAAAATEQVLRDVLGWDDARIAAARAAGALGVAGD